MKEVTMFKSNDGQLFPTKEACEEHEKSFAMIDWLDNEFGVNGLMIVDAMKKNPLTQQLFCKPELKGVWILGYHINSYNQENEPYFIAAFDHLPTTEEIYKELCFKCVGGDYAEDLLKHIVDGGGRRDSEDTWYTLSFEEFGPHYRKSAKQFKGKRSK